MRGKSFRSSVTCLSALALLTTSALSAQAVTAPPKAPVDLVADVSSAVTPLTEAEREDITRYATQYGINVDQAIAHYQYQDDFTRIYTAITKQFPDSYAVAKYATLGDSDSYIAFRGPVPAVVADMLKSFPIPVKLVGGYPLSRTESQKVVTAALTTFSKESGSQSAGAHIVPGRTTIIIDYFGGKSDERVTSLVRQAASLASPSGEMVFDVVASEGAVPIYEPHVLSGGTELNQGFQFCTAGFTVRNYSTGQTGLITASHCRDDLKYENNNWLNFAGHLDSKKLDIQWFSSSQSVWRKFVYKKVNGQLQLRDALSSDAIALDTTHCFYGVKSLEKSGCVNMWANDIQITDNERSLPIIVSLGSYVVSGQGDSGGPWYYGNSARGIVGGAYTNAAGKRYEALAETSNMEVNSNLRIITQ